MKLCVSALLVVSLALIGCIGTPGVTGDLPDPTSRGVRSPVIERTSYVLGFNATYAFSANFDGAVYQLHVHWVNIGEYESLATIVYTLYKGGEKIEGGTSYLYSKDMDASLLKTEIDGLTTLAAVSYRSQGDYIELKLPKPWQQ